MEMSILKLDKTVYPRGLSKGVIMKRAFFTMVIVLLAIVAAAQQSWQKNMKIDQTYRIIDFNHIAPTNNILTNNSSSVIAYTNQPGYSNVQEALDALFYVSPTVSLSGGGTYDIGRVVTNASLSWTVNKTMVTRNLTGPTNIVFGAGGNGSYVHSNVLMQTSSPQKTYTMTVGDGTGTDADTATFAFLNRKYWGFNNVTNSINDAQIIALANSQLTTTKDIGPTDVTPSGSQYIWVCYPQSFGGATFRLNGLLSTGWNVETGNFVNAYGYTNVFLKYRSPQLYSVQMTLEVD